jgi:hypothetical protein
MRKGGAEASEAGSPFPGPVVVSVAAAWSGPGKAQGEPTAGGPATRLVAPGCRAGGSFADPWVPGLTASTPS